jgi:hypothetical protein
MRRFTPPAASPAIDKYLLQTNRQIRAKAGR